jgi:hypothetical protein
MLSSENCGAQPDRTEEELRASEERLRQWSVDLHARLEREKQKHENPVDATTRGETLVLEIP